MQLPWMSWSDRRRWRSAHTVADLGELMALWLEGELRSWPGYMPGCGPDEETTHLIPSLAALNRAGFLTIASQPGETGTATTGCGTGSAPPSKASSATGRCTTSCWTPLKRPA
ncbi:DUF6919 domain-containing protein [Streptomyces griseoruber]|uniref:DUF6919 domain-containing protein n=1 Tax=Streptomyces griseoruber TaxID=1943 RepID=UPI000B181333|nr:hypothetical protein [Streptomyces griseoruber]